MNEVQLYPEWKQAAEDIATHHDPTKVYTFQELEDSLDCKRSFSLFHIRLMKLKESLLKDYGIDFINVHQVGYKIATPEESLHDSVEKQHKKVLGALTRQAVILSVIERPELTSRDKDMFDRKATRNGLIRAFVHKTTLSRCVPGSNLSTDLPKITDGR